MVYNMNEKQGESFTRVVLKKAGRAKERVCKIVLFYFEFFLFNLCMPKIEIIDYLV